MSEEKLYELLKWAYKNMTFLETGIDMFGEQMEYDFCKVCGKPEWKHKEDCQALVWEKQVKAILSKGK